MFSTISGSSKSSIRGPQGASERLAFIFFDDTALQSSCIEAVEKIPLERLERNLRRLLRVFSKDLEEEAATPKEKQVAKYVGTQARRSAYLICTELDPDSEGSMSKKTSEEFSDSDSDVDGDDLADLDYFEAFISNSLAFEALRVNLGQFVSLSEPAGRDVEEATARGTPILVFVDSDVDVVPSTCSIVKQSSNPAFQRVIKIVHNLFHDPPLAEGMKRVRWTCSCGKNLYDDYEELEKGAAKQFQIALRQSLHQRTRQQPDPHHKANSIFRGIRSLGPSLVVLFGFSYAKSLSRNTELPTFELQAQSQPSPTTPAQNSTTDQLFLLLCVNESTRVATTRAHQPAVHDIDSDRKLFHMFRAYYTSIRKRWWSWLSLWELQHIYFVSFEMYDKSLVDIKELNAIPPAEHHTSYRYEPSKLKPPIGSNLLMHYFCCPDDAPSATPCFRKMPKKMNQKLTVCPVQGVSPGWGLHFVEGWNWKKILTVSCFVFILASLAVGVLYWKFEHSIQDAFTIGMFMLACFAISIGTLQAWSSIA